MPFNVGDKVIIVGYCHSDSTDFQEYVFYVKDYMDELIGSICEIDKVTKTTLYGGRYIYKLKGDKRYYNWADCWLSKISDVGNEEIKQYILK